MKKTDKVFKDKRTSSNSTLATSQLERIDGKWADLCEVVVLLEVGAMRGRREAAGRYVT
jgi:hypothetical protein